MEMDNGDWQYDTLYVIELISQEWWKLLSSVDWWFPYTMVSTWAAEHPMEYLSAVLGVLTALCAGLVWRDRRGAIASHMARRRQDRRHQLVLKRAAMGKKQIEERRAIVKKLISQKLTDDIEDLWFEGRITTEERNEYYVMFGNNGLVDMLPCYSKEQVKKNIKLRRSLGWPVLGQEKPAWGPNPGEKPVVKP